MPLRVAYGSATYGSHPGAPYETHFHASIPDLDQASALIVEALE